MSAPRLCAAPGCSADLEALGKRASARTCSPRCRQAAKRARAVRKHDARGDSFRCSAPHGRLTVTRPASGSGRSSSRSRNVYGSASYRAREVHVPLRCDRPTGHEGEHSAHARVSYSAPGVVATRDRRVTWTDAEGLPDPADVSGRRMRARLLEALPELEDLSAAAWRLLIDAHRATEADASSGAWMPREVRPLREYLEGLELLEARPGRGGWFLPERWREGYVEPEPERPSAADLAELVNRKHGAGAVATGAELEARPLRRSSPMLRGEAPFPATGRACAWCGGSPVVAELSPGDVRTWHPACGDCDARHRELLEASGGREYLAARHLHGATRAAVDSRTRSRQREAAREELEDLSPAQRAGLLMVRRWRDESPRPRHRAGVGPRVAGRVQTLRVLDRLALLEELPGGGRWRLTPRGEDLALELRAAWLEADESDPIHAALARLPLPPAAALAD